MCSSNPASTESPSTPRGARERPARLESGARGREPSDLTFYARQINVHSFRVVETWLVASLMYVTACYLIAAGLRQLERRLAIPR